MIPTPATTQTVTARHALSYVGIILATVLLGSFGQQLAAGHVPIPPEWSWITPVLLAGLVSLTTLLPRVTDSAPNSLAQAAEVVDAPPPALGKLAAPVEHIVTLQVAQPPPPAYTFPAIEKPVEPPPPPVPAPATQATPPA